MEKRFVSFVVLATGLMLAYVTLNNLLAPMKPAPNVGKADNTKDDAKKADPAKAGPANGDVAKEDAAGAKAVDEASGTGKAGESPTTDSVGKGVPPSEKEAKAADSVGAAPNVPPADGAPPAAPAIARQWVTLGHFAPNHPFKLLAVLTNRGAAIERLELVERTGQGRFRFRDLEESSGYLGYLALVDELPSGCRVHVVPPGSPAALATCSSVGVGAGLQTGDLLVRVAKTPIATRAAVGEVLQGSKPGQSVEVDVHRPGVGELTFVVELAERPLAMIGPETPFSLGPGPNPPSFRVGLRAPLVLTTIVRDLVEDPGLATLDWEVVRSDESSVEFRLPITAAGAADPILEVRKRFRLARIENEDTSPGYHLDVDVEIRNTSGKAQSLALQWEGPNGLPNEGWWYANKIHPSFFGSAGARDLVWNVVGNGHQIRGARELYQQARSEAPDKPVFTADSPDDLTELRYAGIDAQYFCVAMMPKGLIEGEPLQVTELIPHAVGDMQALDKARIKLANASFLLGAGLQRLEPGATWRHELVVFAGPKEPAVLDAYGIGDILYYGWFPWVAKPLSALLHTFHHIVGNYGLAIIMLTILVRACMFPLSRKAARNAAMMQELAPEMKKIADKYKNDMEKRMKAQKELYAKYNFNPFGGCLLMFVQLPIFIGLYRCLSVDINLRQAPLIPGLDWSSNLAGPDQLWRWPLPEFLAGETGFLGPYLNILPIATIILFLVQQKLFTPPATDEQTRMQQQMMKFMMVFIGVMFFKVPSGLCIYFIASSIWGIAERLLLPKSNLTPGQDKSPPAAAGRLSTGGNGTPVKTPRKQRRR